MFRFDRCWSCFMLSEHRELRRQRKSSNRSDETRIWKFEIHCSELCFISDSTHSKNFSVSSQHKYRHDTLRWCSSCSLSRFTDKAELYFRHMSWVLSSFLTSSSFHSSESLSFSTLNRNAVLALHYSSWESCSLTKLRAHVETLTSSRQVTIKIFVKSWQQKIEQNQSTLIIQRRARNHSQRNEIDQLFTVL